MGSLNVYTATGRCTRDPELKHVGQNGTPLLVFNVAVDFGTRVDGRWETKAMFIKVELWGNRAETLHDWFDKGSPIAFSGELREDEWTDREGATRKSLACKASSVEPIETKAQREDRRGGKKSGGGGSGWDPDAGSSGSDVDEDIPF